MTQPDDHNGDRQLWASVILQALEDAAGAIAGTYNPSSRQNLRNQARAWFTNGGADFREVCALAGVEADEVRAEALRRIEAFDKGEIGRAKTIVHNGERMTMKELSARTGLSVSSLDHRIKRGMRGDALTAPLRSAMRLTFNGQTLTPVEWSQITGIAAHTIKGRIKAGWPVDMALTMSAGQAKRRSTDRAKAALRQAARSRRIHPQAKTYAHAGQSKTIDQWAAEIGMSRRTLASRLAAGWSIDRALSAPVQKKGVVNGPGGGSQLPEERGDRRGESRSIDSRIGNPK